MKGITVLVADDSALMRVLIKEILKNEPDISNVIVASNGKDALEKTLANKPDVILMDMNMGDYDGIYGVKRIMEQRPTPIIILSSIGNTTMSPILEAMKLGAFDYLNKPVNSSGDMNLMGEDIIRKIKVAATANVVSYQNEKQVSSPHTFGEDLSYDIVAIGSSTGGPPAIENILSKLPENFALPVIIVQHMPENFVPSFAQRLNSLCALNVVLARKGDIIQPGNVYIAPGSRNMIVKRNAKNEVEIDFTKKTFKEYNYPSVNSLMLSVAETYGKKSIGIILTGMGKDGAEGIKEIYKSGGYTIAQSKESCVVYGMPKEAVDSGSIKQIVPINDLSMFLVSCIS